MSIDSSKGPGRVETSPADANRRISNRASSERWDAVAHASPTAIVILFMVLGLSMPFLLTSCSSEPRVIAAGLKGDSATVHSLLNDGASIDSLSSNNSTLLHIAPMNSDIVLANRLLSLNANVNARNIDNRTPLHFAARKSYPIVANLVKHGADVNVESYSLQTPLIDAIASVQDNDENFSIIHFLVEHGADIDVVDSYNSNALAYAAYRHKTKALKYLLKSGAIVNLPEFNNPGDYYVAGDVLRAAIDVELERGDERKALKYYEMALEADYLAEHGWCFDKTTELRNALEEAKADHQVDSTWMKALSEALWARGVSAYASGSVAPWSTTVTMGPIADAILLGENRQGSKKIQKLSAGLRNANKACDETKIRTAQDWNTVFGKYGVSLPPN